MSLIQKMQIVLCDQEVDVFLIDGKYYHVIEGKNDFDWYFNEVKIESLDPERDAHLRMMFNNSRLSG